MRQDSYLPLAYGFGFGIDKVYDYLKSAGVHDSVDPIRSTLIFGTRGAGRVAPSAP
jgi:hypothetical protein